MTATGLLSLDSPTFREGYEFNHTYILNGKMLDTNVKQLLESSESGLRRSKLKLET